MTSYTCTKQKYVSTLGEIILFETYHIYFLFFPGFDIFLTLSRSTVKSLNPSTVVSLWMSMTIFTTSVIPVVHLQHLFKGIFNSWTSVFSPVYLTCPHFGDSLFSLHQVSDEISPRPSKKGCRHLAAAPRNLHLAGAISLTAWAFTSYWCGFWFRMVSWCLINFQLCSEKKKKTISRKAVGFSWSGILWVTATILNELPEVWHRQNIVPTLTTEHMKSKMSKSKCKFWIMLIHKLNQNDILWHYDISPYCVSLVQRTTNCSGGLLQLWKRVPFWRHLDRQLYFANLWNFETFKSQTTCFSYLVRFFFIQFTRWTR